MQLLAKKVAKHLLFTASLPMGCTPSRPPRPGSLASGTASVKHVGVVLHEKSPSSHMGKQFAAFLWIECEVLKDMLGHVESEGGAQRVRERIGYAETELTRIVTASQS
jgi:hypothetical protein